MSHHSIIALTVQLVAMLPVFLLAAVIEQSNFNTVRSFKAFPLFKPIEPSPAEFRRVKTRKDRALLNLIALCSASISSRTSNCLKGLPVRAATAQDAVGMALKDCKSDAFLEFDGTIYCRHSFQVLNHGAIRNTIASCSA